MRRTGIDTDVLIVGAGPVGLFLANECARRGLRSRIIEANAAQSIHSKALAIFPRTLEILDMAGIVGPFLEKANRVTSVAVATRDRRLGQMRFAPAGSPYPFIAMIPQDMTERLLVDHLKSVGGTVEYETKFVSAVHEDDYVSVDLEVKGEPANLTACFVVGCDGAHSAVRHRLDLPFEGAEYAASFMLADVETNDMLPADEMQLCPNEHGPIAIFPMSARRRRIVAIIDKIEGEAPSLELVQSLLAERAPRGIEASELHWSSYFRIHHRHAAHLRNGRVFLAGDAAHIHSPFGGQGMNTGLHDAWNLIWKLEMSLRGHGSEQLLDSYSEERLPVIIDVIETTDRLTKVMGTPNKLAQFLRDSLIPAVSHFTAFQHAFVNRLSGLGIAYAGSSIVEGRGERLFEGFMEAGGIPSAQFVLLLPNDASPSLRNSVQSLATEFHEVLIVRTSQMAGIRLVRPDGYLAFSTDSEHGERTWETIRALLKRMTWFSARVRRGRYVENDSGAVGSADHS